MRARLNIEGLREAQARLDHIGDRARRPEPAMRSHATQRDLEHSQRRKFARGGWRRASPDWVEEKRRRGLDTRTLRATGKLETALTHAMHGVRVTAFGGELRWGVHPGASDIYYAQALAKGGRSGPPRRMVLIDKVAVERISLRIERYVVEGVTR